MYLYYHILFLFLRETCLKNPHIRLKGASEIIVSLFLDGPNSSDCQASNSLTNQNGLHGIPTAHTATVSILLLPFFLVHTAALRGENNANYNGRVKQYQAVMSS